MPSQNSALQPCADRQHASATDDRHPLYRLAIEEPEHLEPTLRRAALRMVRRRLSRWLREKLSSAVSQIELPHTRATHQV
jgi:hypothetical protein